MDKYFLSLHGFLQVSVAVMDDLDDDLDHDPQVVIDCEKPTLHVDINTGDWVADKNNTSLCTADKGEILRCVGIEMINIKLNFQICKFFLTCKLEDI